MQSKVYVNVPAGAVAGGVESLYQLVDAINSVGGKAYVVFDKPQVNAIPEKYHHYNLITTSEIEDNNNNWIVYPEVWTGRIDEYKNIKKAIWWLSVDNNHGQFKDWHREDITHFYQSYYAMSYVINNGASYYLPVFDYINDKYIHTHTVHENKQNIVCYNPAKGQDITNKIISLNPDIKFVPLVNMTESEIIETLKISKVYIDFGNHPGRDRIPREAALLHNCVITNFAGSAMFYNDVPIKTEYKTDTPETIGDKIRDCFNNFEKNISNFELYRRMIKEQRQQTFNQAAQIFQHG
jgi:hypothetical protein